jgi:hypothetical protein
MSKPRERAKSTRSHAEPRAKRTEQVARLEDRTRVELFETAQRLGIAGYAEMTKGELVEAIRRR